MLFALMAEPLLGLPADIYGYLISFCTVSTAVKCVLLIFAFPPGNADSSRRFSTCSKALSPEFVLGKLTTVDLGVCVTEGNEANVFELITKNPNLFKSVDTLSITVGSINADAASKTISAAAAALAPRLRRFSRLPFTIFLHNQQLVVPCLNPSLLEHLDVQVGDKEALLTLLSHPLPLLRYLAVDNGSSASVLQAIANSTGSLEILKICLAKASQRTLDLIRSIAIANRYLRILDIHHDEDGSAKYYDLHASSTRALMTEIAGDCAVTPAKWDQLPGAILSALGVPISSIRIFGCSLWDFIVHSLRGSLPDPEPVEAFYDAVYATASPEDKADAFSRFLLPHYSVDSVLQTCPSWMRRRIFSIVESIENELPAHRLEPFLRAVCICALSSDDFAPEARRLAFKLATVSSPRSPYTAFANALDCYHRARMAPPSSQNSQLRICMRWCLENQDIPVVDLTDLMHNGAGTSVAAFLDTHSPDALQEAISALVPK